MGFKFIKYLLIIVLLGLLVFGLLNFTYFTKQARFHLGKVFITEVQRQELRKENPIKYEPNQLVIESLDIVAPIQFVTEASETAYQAALVNGVVLFPGTAEVGQAGNTYIFGHSSDFAFSKGNFKTVFALLPQIEIGAPIIVSDKEGTKYTYKVYDKFVAEKTRTDLLSQETNGKAILTLQTSYPIGTALKRYIVKAKLVED